MIHYYAQIDATGRVIAVSQLSAPVGAPDMIALPEYDTSLAGKLYDAQTGLFAAPPAVPEPAPAWAWLIDIGPFFDRFGSAKMAVLTSADSGVKAILADLQVRKWIDLQRADVATGLQYVGTVVPAVTAELQQAILTTPVEPEEHLALRKLYFV